MQPKWSKLQRFIWESRETRGLKASGQSIYCPNGNTDIFLLVKAGNIDRTIRVGSNKNTIIKGTSVRFITQFLTAMITSWNVWVIIVWATVSPDWTVQIGQPVHPYCRVVNMWSFQVYGSPWPIGPSLLTFFWLFLSWKVVSGWRVSLEFRFDSNPIKFNQNCLYFSDPKKKKTVFILLGGCENWKISKIGQTKVPAIAAGNEWS